MKILVTGGAGFIGSHTCIELLAAGHDLVVVDDLSNSKYEAVRRVQKLAARELEFHQLSLLDENALTDLLERSQVDAVIHFAAFKAVGESVQKPLEYYRNNVAGTIQLLQAMRAVDCWRLVYSSSCTVYGEPQFHPVTEQHPVANAESPYGWTKLMTEQIMRDCYASDDRWQIALLRYFNPVGAHPSGELGEDPNGIPNNLMPYITQVALGNLPQLNIFGGDYDTRDGTCIRDYLHVVDLANAHVKALQKVSRDQGLFTYNLGTGTGSTVLEVVAAFKQATGIDLPHQIVGRRAGDIVAAYADPSRAERELGWKATRNLADMCRDGWNWQQKNPNGLLESACR